MKPDQSQAQSPQPGQPTGEEQTSKEKDTEGNTQKSQKGGHLMGEDDGIPGGREDSEATDEASEQGRSDAGR
jgi:hypothetical protein